MNMQESWLNGDGMTDEQEKWLKGKENKMENKNSPTEETLMFITSSLENINDPRLIANVAIGAIMVLCKRLMYDGKEDKK